MAASASSSANVKTFEQLGTFYLGRHYDLAKNALGAEPVLYDSRDLVTHGVIVGMTGSGKTGLGITLIEEALIDNIPVLAIDPKGDLANLLLTFPNLAPGDFRPWIDEDEAARQKLTPDAYAAQQAEAWKNGLAQWDEDGERIARLKDAAEFVIYTPGSKAGVPLSILKSFAAPPEAEREDSERMAEAVTTTATGVLTMLGIDADPVQSREHILIAAILNDAWHKGEDLDLATIIQRIQQPPFTRVGVLELQAFYPEKDRFGLAMRLNGLLAAPGFAMWLEGQPMDVGAMLHASSGKPRCAIVSIAHLNDAERMFFVTLLLNQVVSWMRAQSGTSSLRAMLYMDEVAGYMPPVAAPPSKAALLLLMKQARAFGLGVVLATQNPVDLDYKGLSNAGTWFLGRLQTERDKARLLDGLEGALGGQASGAKFDRGQADSILSSLPKRTFYMHNVHEDAPEIFQTRWTLSYLRGPLTRDQIKQLRPAFATAAAATAIATATASSASSGAAAQAKSQTAAAAPAAAAAAVASAGSAESTPPMLPPGIEQFFLPSTKSASGALHYEPSLYACASVRFVDAKRKVDFTRTQARLVPFGSGAVAVDWDSSEEAPVPVASLETAPRKPADFGSLPAAAAKPASYASWSKEYARWLRESQQLDLFYDEETGTLSEPDETEAAFRARLQLVHREQRDDRTEELRKQYAPKVEKLTAAIARAEQAVEREKGQQSAQMLQTAVSMGSTILGALLGRKTLSVANMGRATTAARGVGRTMKEQEDVKRAADNVEKLKAQLADLNSELEAEIAAQDAAPSPTRPLTAVTIKTTPARVAVDRILLVWVP
jgi:hypothetical protein